MPANSDSTLFPCDSRSHSASPATRSLNTTPAVLSIQRESRRKGVCALDASHHVMNTCHYSSMQRRRGHSEVALRLATVCDADLCWTYPSSPSSYCRWSRIRQDYSASSLNMLPLHDFNVMACALITVSAAVGYGYTRRHPERRARLNRCAQSTFVSCAGVAETPFQDVRLTACKEDAF